MINQYAISEEYIKSWRNRSRQEKTLDYMLDSFETETGYLQFSFKVKNRYPFHSVELWKFEMLKRYD